MNVRYRVELSQTERTELTELLSGGKHAARRLKRAQILLAADGGASDEAIATNVGVGSSTVYRTKRRFVLGNLEAALSEEPRPGANRKLSGKEEALLVATACSNPPAGRARWTLELLSGELVRLTAHESVSRETVRRRLAENDLSHGARTCGAFRRSTPTTSPVWRTCSIFIPKRPIPSARWSASTRARFSSSARSAGRSRPSRGKSSATTANINATEPRTCSVLDVNRPWRKAKVTERRAAEDFAVCMRDLTDVHYPEAERIRVVIDNLSTHSAGALYQTFPADEARRVLRRLEFHYVPKHASWLNMVEIEIGVLASQCLDRRIESYTRLVAETAAWEKRRNAEFAASTGCSPPKKPAPKWGALTKPTLKSDENQRMKNLCDQVLSNSVWLTNG